MNEGIALRVERTSEMDQAQPDVQARMELKSNEVESKDKKKKKKKKRKEEKGGERERHVKG